MEVLNYHAPLKTKYLRANEQPFMSKELRKAHMKRSRLRNKYRKNKNDVSEVAFKKQRNYCVSLLKKVKKSYFGKLQPSSICDNKMFWKTVKPLFSKEAVSTDNITLIENNVIISEDEKVAEIFNNYFTNAVKT